MKRLWLLAACGVAASCTCGPQRDSALRVVITVDEALLANCVDLELSAAGSVLLTQTMPREAGKTRYQVGVKRGDLPPTVTYQAVAYLAQSCADRGNRKANGRSEAVERAFPQSGVEEVALALNAPDATVDADRDGYVDIAKGGSDCNDADALVRPAGAQVCSSATDNDCDGRLGCDDTDCLGQVACQSLPTKLVITPATLSVGRGDCSGALTVQTQDLFGPAVVGVPTDVALSAVGAPLQFFSDASCATAITSAFIPFGQSSGSVFVRGAQPGTATLTAQSGGLTPGTAAVTVTAQPATQLVFTTPMRSLVAGECAAPLTLELRDSLGRGTTVAAALTVGLSANPALGVSFHAEGDTACATPLASPSVLIGAGLGTVSFRVRSTRAVAAPVVLTATTTTSLTATQDLAVAADVPVKVGFVTPPQGVQVNQCSAGPVTVQLQDQFDNRSLARAPASVTLGYTTGTTGTLTFFRTGACAAGDELTSLAIAQGQAEGSFFLRGTARGLYTLRATWNGAAATQAANIVTGPPTRLVIVTAAVTNAVAGACSPAPVRVQTQDSSGSPSGVTGSTLNVAVALNPAGAAQLFSDAACTTALAGGVLPLAVGATEGTIYFRGTVARTFNLAVSATSFTGDNQNETIRPGAPSVLRWTPSPTTLTVQANACAQPLALGIEDAWGNTTAFGAATPLTPSAPAGLTFFDSNNCGGGAVTTVAVGSTAISVTFSARSTVVGTYPVTATAGSATSSAPPASVVVTPANADRLVFNPTPPATLTAGGCQPATVQRRDPYGNAAPVAVDTAITLSDDAAPATALEFFATAGTCATATVPVSSVTMTTGSSTVSFWVRATRAGAVTITAARGGLTDATHPFTVNPGVGAALVLVGLPASQTAGACSGAVTVRRDDAFGNAAPDATPLTVGLAATGSGAGTAEYFGTTDCTGTAVANVAIAGGQSTRTFSLRGRTSGSVTTTATGTGVTQAQGSTTINPAAPTLLLFTNGTSPLSAGTCGLLAVQTRDQYGNVAPVSGNTTLTLSSTSAGVLTFYTSTDCTTGAGGNVAIPNAQSQVSFSFKPNRAPETVTLTASPGGAIADATQQWMVSVGPPDRLVWKAAPPTPLTRYSCGGTVATIEVQDLGGNPSPVPGPTTVTLASSAPTAGVQYFAAAGCPSTAIATLNLPTNATEGSVYIAGFGSGTTQLSATATGVPNGTPNAPVQVNGAAGTLVVTSTVADLEAGACVPVTVTRRDSASAAVTLGTTAVSLTSGDASVTLHGDVNCTAALPALSIAWPASIVIAYARGRSGAPTTATQTASGTYYSNGTLDLRALPLVRRGSCDLTNGNATATCAVTPTAPIPNDDLTRTFLVYQSTGTAATPSDSTAECHLDDTAGVNVVCTRVGNGGLVSVRWQTVSWGRPFSQGGVSVQHGFGSLTGATPNPHLLTLGTPVTLAQAFLLFSSGTQGNVFDHNDQLTGRLSDASTIALGESNATFPTGTYAVQVVELAGASVTRGIAAGAGNSIDAGVLASAAVARSVPLFTARPAQGVNDDNVLCKRRLRGTVASATALSFTRGNGAGGACVDADIVELPWERVEFPTSVSVQSAALTVGSGSTSATGTLAPAVTSHRTLLLLAGQGPGGQSSGETDFAGNTANDDDPGVVHGYLSMPSSTQIRVDRARSDGVAVFTPYIVEFTP